MVAPRMLGPEVRRCYEEGVGFITAVGVHRDVTGTARARTLAVAKAIGGLRQGAIELTPMQEAVLDLAVEQALSPALRKVNESFVGVMLEHGIPLEAILTELFLSGEVERTYRLVRLEGDAAQMVHHSPTSQYGQLSRIGKYDHLDVAATMRDLGRRASRRAASPTSGTPSATPAIPSWSACGRPRWRPRSSSSRRTSGSSSANERWRRDRPAAVPRGSPGTAGALRQPPHRRPPRAGHAPHRAVRR